MLRVFTALQSRFRDDTGATLVEYALLLVLIAVVAIGIITSVGNNVSSTFDTVNDSLTNATP
ncbi:MAG: Flp family type IVb pilin [Acidimicrobiia bacterium]